MELVSWERVVSASLAVPAVPMIALTIGIGDDGEFWDYRQPVLGILVEVCDTYERAKRGQYDFGNPQLPPTPRSLTDEGYRFERRTTKMQYIVHNSEYQCPDPKDECGNTYVLYFPASEEGPEEQWIADAKKLLRSCWEDRKRDREKQTSVTPDK